MAALLLLVAIIGGVLVGDLVLENTAAGSAAVLHHPITGSNQGRLLAMAAALGFVLGLLVVGSVSLRRTRRARRRQLGTAERDLTAEVAELERENTSPPKELAHRNPPVHRPSEAARPADLDTASTATSSRCIRRPGGSPGSIAT